jgi:hypothetical protein
VGGEQRRALGLGQCRVALGDAERGEHLVERGAVHLHVLADVELGVVKTEDLDLPDHVAQVPASTELAAVGLQRLLDAAQVGEHLARRAVGAVCLTRRRTDALANEGQRAAVGLIRVQRRDAPCQLRKVLLAEAQDLVEARARWRDLRRE